MRRLFNIKCFIHLLYKSTKVDLQYILTIYHAILTNLPYLSDVLLGVHPEGEIGGAVSGQWRVH